MGPQSLELVTGLRGKSAAVKLAEQGLPSTVHGRESQDRSGGGGIPSSSCLCPPTRHPPPPSPRHQSRPLWIQHGLRVLFFPKKFDSLFKQKGHWKFFKCFYTWKVYHLLTHTLESVILLSTQILILFCPNFELVILNWGIGTSSALVFQAKQPWDPAIHRHASISQGPGGSEDKGRSCNGRPGLDPWSPGRDDPWSPRDANQNTRLHWHQLEWLTSKIHKPQMT